MHLNLYTPLLSFCLLLLSQICYAQIVPGANWTDTDGNIIQAHGSGLIKVEDTYWWFGEMKDRDNQYFLGVGCYHSKDLTTWTRVPDVLKNQTGTALNSSMVVERPKVIYNAKTKRYVMYFHYDSTNYGLAEVGVASSAFIDRDWQFESNFKPLGTESRDMSLFQDDDGSAYLIYASDGNANLKVAQLSDDYLNVTSITYQWDGKYWEAAGVVKQDGLYYMLFSKQSGWTANDNLAVYASSLKGPWSEAQQIAPTGFRTYSSQNAYDITVAGTSATTYIYCGDRWRSDALGTSTYIWLPFTIVNNVVTLTWADVWTVDTVTGTHSIAQGNTYNATADLVYAGGAYYGDSMVRYLGAGGSVTFNNVGSLDGSGGAHWVSTYSSNGDSTYRLLTASANGGPKVSMPQPSTGGGTTLLSTPIKLELQPGSSNSITFEGTATGYAADLEKIIIY